LRRSLRARAAARVAWASAFRSTPRGLAFPFSPADFRKLIADETEKWAKVIKFAGIKAD
jgi:hypothetical protein